MCRGGAGKEGSHGTEEEEESEGDLASAIILPWPCPPRMFSHLRHGDKVTEPLAAAAVAGKHGKSNSAKTTTRLILGETRRDKSLPLEAVARFTASKLSHQSEDRALDAYVVNHGTFLVRQWQDRPIASRERGMIREIQGSSS